MKFYIRCGTMRFIISKPSVTTHLQAACEAMLSCAENHTLSNDVFVNETGFSSKAKKFDLQKVLKKAGFDL